MPAHATAVPEKLSAVVVSYNRAAVIGTCLRALGFADEVIVIDKSSTDATPAIAAQHADRVVTVPWTAVVEDTRAFAVAQCSGAWILCLDDDECLDPEAGKQIRLELAEPRADIYCLPLRHYILGVHDEAAYYWPEHHPRLFRRDSVTFTATVHGGIQLHSDRILQLPADGPVVIHHLSHRDVAEWIEKCNRYTARPERHRVNHAGQDVVAFAHARIDHWLARTRDRTPGLYPATAAVLRAVYDIVDRLKTWEEERGLDGSAAFARISAALDSGYAALPGAVDRPGLLVQGSPAPLAAVDDGGDGAAHAMLGARLAELRASCDASAAEAARWAGVAAHWAAEAAHEASEAARLEDALAAADRRLQDTDRILATTQQTLAAIERSTFWRATGGARRLVDHARRLVRRR